MITYKGQKTVIGKHFIYEGETLTYLGKIYGDSYNFISDKQVQYILDESDLPKLKEYNINGEDTNTIKDVDTNNVLRDIILKYTEKELNLISDLLQGKTDNKEELNKLYEEEYKELSFLNKYDIPPKENSNVSLEAQQSFLKEINRNVSGVNIITLLASLQDFIVSNKGDEIDANI